MDIKWEIGRSTRCEGSAEFRRGEARRLAFTFFELPEESRPNIHREESEHPDACTAFIDTRSTHNDVELILLLLVAHRPCF